MTVIGALALGIAVASPLCAQSLPVTDTLLSRLTSEGLAGNPPLVAGRALARAAEARVRPAGALPDPTVEVGVMDLTLPEFAFHESDFTDVDLELSQEFPWPGSQGARTGVARADALAREADVGTHRREVTVRVAELYYRLRYVVTARGTLVRQRALLAAAVEISTARYATNVPPAEQAWNCPAPARVLSAKEGGRRLANASEPPPGRGLLCLVRETIV